MAAMAEELAALLRAATDEGVRTERVVGLDLHHARLAGMDVVLVQSGIGKVAAASAATVLVQRCEALLMVGTAGGLRADVHPGDVVVADALLQHDVDARPLFGRWVVPSVGRARLASDPSLSAALMLGARRAVRAADERGDLLRADLPPVHGRAREDTGSPTVHRGLILSGDQFVQTAQQSHALVEALPDALAVEMEGAAVAQVCAMAGVPFAVARTISDRADHDATVDFTRFLASVAAPYARDIVLETLARLA